MARRSALPWVGDTSWRNPAARRFKVISRTHLMHVHQVILEGTESVDSIWEDPAGALKKQHSHVPMTADNLTTGAAR